MAGAAALAAGLGRAAAAQTPFIVDGAGREVPIPTELARVLPAGPPAAILLYTLAPELMLGWPRANRPEERALLHPVYGALPEVGRLTGRGNTASLEAVLAMRPQLILDVGSTRRTYAELADRTQRQLGVPYAVLDGRLDVAAGTYAVLGRLTGREARAATLGARADAILAEAAGRARSVPPERRPRVYYARGPAGLETGLAGSINVEILEIMGLRNVAAELTGGLAQVSLEQVLRWDPDVIVTIDQSFAARVGADPGWAGVRAVRDGRVHLSPKLPFGWVDFPPAVNRLMGLWWLGKVVYPSLFPEDLAALTIEFYREFYHVEIDAAQAARVLDGRI